MGVTAFMLGITLLVAVASFGFQGETNPFTDCTDPNDCTGAAIEDLADFNIFTDLADILQFVFIFFGDLIELLSFPGLGLPPIAGLFILLGITLPWIFIIVGLARGVPV